MITVYDTRIDVDIRAELENYTWIRPRWTTDYLMAASPFRYETTPSFYVYLTDTTSARAGDWGDRGASDPEWQRGGFVKLLAYLRQESYVETYEYLRDTYANDSEGAEVIALSMSKLDVSEPYRPLDDAILREYRYRSPYLGERGISEVIQRLMRIGYDRKRKAVTIPWFNTDGTLGNVKFRRVDEKTFWYAKGGRKLSEMVYGMNVVYQRRIKRAVIVEAEIDAMSVMTSGTMAIAVGGTAFTRAKADLIRRSPLEEIVILRDNDAAGRLLQRKILAELSGHLDVKVAIIPLKYGKDANDALMRNGPEVLRRAVLRSKRVHSLKFAIVL